MRTSVRFRKKLNRQRYRRRQRGFTLIEALVIVVVVGVLAALATPSFIGMMDSLRVDRTISEVRVALQSTQRQAIRGTKVCTVALQMAPAATSSTGTTNTATAPGHLRQLSQSLIGWLSGNRGSNSSITAAPVDKNSISGDCLTSGAPDLPENVSMATNIVGTNSGSSGIDIKYGVLGGAEFAIQDPTLSTTRDSSGKIVAFVPSQQNPKKKCIAVSSTLGLTRVGTYVGETDPASITQSGVCTALEWNKQ